MKDIINAPVTIIPFRIFKMKVIQFLSSTLSDLINVDISDESTIDHTSELLREVLGSHYDVDIINIVKNNPDFFDPLLLKYYENDAVMVFVELLGNLFNLYTLRDDELNSYGDMVKVLENNQKTS